MSRNYSKRSPGGKVRIMDYYKEIIHSARPGQIIPIVKQIDIDEPVNFFAKLSDYGRAKNCCLFESREYLTGSGALTFGTAKPALYLTGTGVILLSRHDDTGKRMLNYLSAQKRGSLSSSVWPGDNYRPN